MSSFDIPWRFRARPRLENASFAASSRQQQYMPKPFQAATLGGSATRITEDEDVGFGRRMALMMRNKRNRFHAATLGGAATRLDEQEDVGFGTGLRNRRLSMPMAQSGQYYCSPLPSFQTRRFPSHAGALRNGELDDLRNHRTQESLSRTRVDFGEGDRRDAETNLIVAFCRRLRSMGPALEECMAVDKKQVWQFFNNILRTIEEYGKGEFDLGKPADTPDAEVAFGYMLREEPFCSWFERSRRKNGEIMHPEIFELLTRIKDALSHFDADTVQRLPGLRMFLQTLPSTFHNEYAPFPVKHRSTSHRSSFLADPRYSSLAASRRRQGGGLSSRARRY